MLCAAKNCKSRALKAEDVCYTHLLDSLQHAARKRLNPDRCCAPGCNRGTSGSRRLRLCLPHYSATEGRRVAQRVSCQHRAYGEILQEAELQLERAPSCVYCSRSFSKGWFACEAEHVVPILALGGTNIWWNRVPSCAGCNRGRGGKHTKAPSAWLNGRSLSTGVTFEALTVAEEKSLLLSEVALQRESLQTGQIGSAPWWSIWARMGMPLNLEEHLSVGWSLYSNEVAS